MSRQSNWDKYEVALLIESVMKIHQGIVSRDDELHKLSNLLRKRAQNLGQTIDDRDLVEKKFIEEVRTTLNSISDDNAKMLYMLVKEGIVDVKIVVRANGIYHDKLALLAQVRIVQT